LLWPGPTSLYMSDPPNNPEDFYAQVAPLMELATEWLARSEGVNVPLELAAYSLRWKGDWRLSIYRTPQEIKGVSIVMPPGDWFLEAQGPLDAGLLTNIAAIHGRHPATLTTTERVSALVRPFLADRGFIAREQKVHVLRCTRPPADKGGRWARSADLPALREYEKQIKRDRRQSMDTAWEALIKRKDLAIVLQDYKVVASLRRYGPAPFSAGIADLNGASTRDASKALAGLTGFVVTELLSNRKSVYVLVDESDTSSLTFYRGLEFEDVGTLYRAYLK
jgi:hypothetical protein